MKKIIKIIDAHTHVFPDKIAEKCRISVGTFYDLPMYTSGTISELEKIRNIHFMQDGIEYRIARQLICSPAVTASQTYNIIVLSANKLPQIEIYLDLAHCIRKMKTLKK